MPVELADRALSAIGVAHLDERKSTACPVAQSRTMLMLATVPAVSNGV
jgi:hypothetical protein